jgi:DNA-binding MarR family transcriptional regulator
MALDPEPAEAAHAAEHLAESMIELCRRAHEDVAPTVSGEQIRGLLALGGKPTDPGRFAGELGVSPASAAELLDQLERRTLVRRLPSGEICLTGAGTCVLEAMRQRRRQLLDQALASAPPHDRSMLRDAFDQLYGVVSLLARVPGPRSPL